MNSNDPPSFADVKPHIPARPVLSLDMFGRETSPCRSVLDVGQAKFTINARTALAHALRHAKIGQGDSVLLPAYHCPAMVSPLAWLGVKPIFYPIRPDTSVDVDVLAGYVQPNSRALVAVHFFGFIQDMRPLREFCDERGLILIEDCAHAFFGEVDGQPPGLQGDYAIASLMKFLPIYEGGCLVSSRRSLVDLDTGSGGLFFQLKALLNTIEMACEYGRLPGFKRLLDGKNWLWGLAKRHRSSHTRVASELANGEWGDTEFNFDPAGLTLGMPWISYAIMKGMEFSHACSLRRANYMTLLQALSDTAGGQPLFSQLPDGVYPQVFPFLIDEPEMVFQALKQRKVPIIRFGEFRWKGVDASACPVSEDLSRRVFQFPCHQSITRQEIDWMITVIRSVLSSPHTLVSG